MRHSHPLRLPLLGLLCAGLTLTAAAQANDIQDAIEYRQSALRTLVWHFGPMGQMAQGRIDYDAEEFARRADNVAALAGLPWEGFVEGSLRGDGHGVDTDALAIIAENLDDFAARQATLREETAALAEVAAGGDFNAVRRQFANVANTCRGCHDNYRAD